MRCSNKFTDFIILLSLTTLLFFASSNIISDLLLSSKASHDCVNFLNYPTSFFFISVLLTLDLLSLYGSYRVRWQYLFLNTLVFLVLLGFIIFAFVVTNKGEGHVMSNREYKEYRLADYSHWFQKRVHDPKTWESIRTCLVHGKYCHDLSVSEPTQDVFFKRYLSPIQSGCCKPPEDCGFTYVSPTQWTKTNNSTNFDCKAWSNNQNTLCYDCDSCKAGFVHDVKDVWKKKAIVNAIFLGLHIIVYSISCCAFYINMQGNAKSKIQGSQVGV